MREFKGYLDYIQSMDVRTITEESMKDIHPELYEIGVTCACGNTVHTRSTAKSIKTTVCSACHPFYTGDQKFVDTAGRIEKFEKKYKKGKAGKA